MSTEIRPLWKLLLDTTKAADGVSLSCDDCFLILEYLAEARRTGVEWERLVQAAKRHLNACPDCHSYYQRRLDQLAALAAKENDVVE